jgi:hypothetical protein
LFGHVVIFEHPALFELAIVALVAMGVRSTLSHWSVSDLAGATEKIESARSTCVGDTQLGKRHDSRDCDRGRTR